MNPDQIEEVRFRRHDTTALALAAGQARDIADRGHVAMVRPTGERRPAAAYVSLDDTGDYRIESAALWPPDWIGRLARILHTATQGEP